MLPILYILHRCNTLQSLGGEFSTPCPGEVGLCALTCLMQTGGQGTQSLRKLLPDLGCSATKQGPSSSSSSFFPPLTLSPSQPVEQQELGMEQHGDATTGVKTQHSASPGPSC